MARDVNNNEVAVDANGNVPVADSASTIVTDGKTLSFTYNSAPVTATVKLNNGLMGVNCPNNEPFSCKLSDLEGIVGTFTIVP